MIELEKQIRSKFYFFKGTRHDCEVFFNNLEQPDKGIEGKNSGTIKLKKSKKELQYDSLYELKVLKDLDNCYFIKEIKTQALAIQYKKDKKYYPDIQLLLYDGSLIIIEVKPFKEMVNKRNLLKRKALRKYCKDNGFAYAIIDHDYYSFDKDLIKENVSDEIQNRFIEFVKEREKVTYTDCKDLKKEYNINDKQICYIIWKNKSSLKYEEHTIKYRKKYS